MPIIAGAGAAATAAAAGAFKYNRANYLFDSGLRFARYTAGYGYAQDQAGQYREDIRDLTALTCAKQDSYHGVAVLFFVLNFQLIMAGRLGVHGPSPPGWLLGIYWTNVSCALMFLCTATWLTLHAEARATAGSAHMLTRTVRIPIPSPKQLDKARRTGNSFEKQRVSDVFRVPFVVPAPKEVGEEEPAADAKKGAAAAPASQPQSKRRMPKWFQDEQRELQSGTGPAFRGANPEHFELYRGLAQEWAGHDCYARIGLLYWMSSWLTSISLYSMCHCFTELRALWPAWTVTPIFCMSHYCVLQTELTEESHSRLLAAIPLEKIVPWTPMLCVLGMTIDYSTLTPNDGWIAVIYILSWICYFIHFAWALRQYELAMPHPQVDQPESPGHAWYPAEWWLPRAFAASFYIVAPPKQLEPGQTCLLQEMKASKGGGVSASPKKARETGPMLFPWRLFRGVLITYISAWALVMFGRVFEQVNGERQLLKQEGRVMRWPSHMQPWMSPWTRNGTRNEFCHAGGCDRRLHELAGAHFRGEQKVAAMAERLAASLGSLAEVLDTNEEVQLPAPIRAPVTWPSDFTPALLASKGEDTMLAMSHERHGVMLQVTGDAAEVVSRFALEGLELGSSLLGASWSASGLLVTSKSGAVAECAGLPVDGRWLCKQVAERLPSGGSSLKAAAVARLPSGLLRAAVSFTEDEGVVLLEADIAGRDWAPSGEVQLSHNAMAEHNFSFSADGEELIIAAKSGVALKWQVGATQPDMIASPKDMGRVWHCACAMRRGRLAHLASAAGSNPELLLASV